MSDVVMNNTGYKKTKLGCIPKDWSITMLMDIVDDTAPIVYGIVQAGPHIPEGVPYIKTTDLSGNSIDSGSLQKTSKEIASKYSRSEVIPGDLVIGLRGDLPNCLQVPSSLPYANLTQGTARIRVNSENHSKFILYSLFAMPVVKRINAVSKGSTFKEISLHDLRRIQIALPPFREQQKIASILSTWDTAIEKTQQLIEKKQHLKKGLMQQLLTGKTRLKGFDKKWKEHSFKELLKQVKRNIEFDDSECYDLISVKRRSGGLFHRSSLYGHQIKTKNLREAKKGDFLISKMQVVHGASGLVTKEFDGMKISGSYIAVTPKNDTLLNVKFLNWISKLPLFYHLTYISSYGVHIEKMTFDFKLFLKSRITVPSSTEEQKAIVEILDKMDEEIKLLVKERDFLQDQKRGLMQQLLTGKTRVKIKN